MDPVVSMESHAVLKKTIRSNSGQRVQKGRKRGLILSKGLNGAQGSSSGSKRGPL